MTTPYKIHKNMELPPKRGGPGAKPKYPFDEMQPGDCFVLDAEDGTQRAAMAAYKYGQRHGMRFTARKINKKEVGIWRVE